MLWFSALWHLLGAVYALTDLSDLSAMALVTGVAVLLVAAAFAIVSTRPGEAHAAGVAGSAPSHERGPIPVRCTDPDAPGRSRPRAPSTATASA